jgi:hypothetical protein
LAEDDRLAVGDEVGLARATFSGGQDQALDDVVDVGGVGDVATATHPGKAARFHRLDHLRQQRGVALAPDEAGAQGDGLEAVARGLSHRLLGFGLRRRIWRSRVRSQRRGLIHPDQRLTGHQRCLGAAVDEAPYACLFAGRQHVSRADHVAALEVLPWSPLTEVGGEVKGHVGAIGAGRKRD